MPILVVWTRPHEMMYHRRMSGIPRTVKNRLTSPNRAALKRPSTSKLAEIDKVKELNRRGKKKTKSQTNEASAKCANCNTKYLPTRKFHKFCSDSCRKQFHRYGSSYGPLKHGLEKALEEKCAEFKKDLMGRVEAFEAAMKSLEAAIKPLLVGREQVRMKIDANGGQ